MDTNTTSIIVALIVTLPSILAAFYAGATARKARKENAESNAGIQSDVTAVRNTLTQNNGGSHVKDWIDDLKSSQAALQGRIEERLDDQDAWLIRNMNQTQAVAERLDVHLERAAESDAVLADVVRRLAESDEPESPAES